MMMVMLLLLMVTMMMIIMPTMMLMIRGMMMNDDDISGFGMWDRSGMGHLTDEIASPLLARNIQDIS